MGFRLFASTTNAMSSIIDRVNFFPSLLSSPPNGSRLLKPVTVFGGKTESRARYIYIYIIGRCPIVVAAETIHELSRDGAAREGTLNGQR